MPQVSPANCVPILQRKIAKLLEFIDEKQNNTGGEAVADAAWERFADVIEQMRNVHGAPTGDTCRRIGDAITRPGMLKGD